MRFIKSNPHPKGKNIGDCVIRAIVYGEGKKWIDVYKDLCDVGESIYDLPNSRKTYETYLLKSGWKKEKMPKHDSRKRMKLSEFIDNNPTAKAIVSVAKHLCYVENGELLDTWDCSHKCVGNYFIKN